ASAGGSLDDHRKADLLGRLERVVEALDRPRRARHRGDLELLGDLPRGGFVAHLADLLRGGPDEGDVGRPDDLRELGVFREEAVARVDGVGTGDFGRGDDAGDVEVAVAARRLADAPVVAGDAD